MGLSTPTVQWYEGNKPVTDPKPYVQLIKVPTSYPRTIVYTCVGRNFTGKLNSTVTANLSVIVQGINTCCEYAIKTVANYYVFLIEKCPKLNDPSNGRFVYLGQGQVAVLQCNPGYYIKIGPTIVYCIEGKWPNQLPSCEKIS